jgi:hypothetical protein
MLAFDLLRLLFADFMTSWIEITALHSTMIRIKACDPNGS